MTRDAAASLRLAPLPPGHVPAVAAEMETYVRTLGFVPNSVLTMQRKPDLLKGFGRIQSAIWSPDSTVDRGFKRLIAHLSAKTAGDAYSMAHTASGSLHFGIAPEKLAALGDYRTSSLFSAAERAALNLAVAASTQPNAVTDDHFHALHRHWSEAAIIEIVAVIAMAGFLTRWNTTFATPLEDEPNAVAEHHLAPQGWRAGAHRS
ncbi:MAG: carboxymuconolactone decarboxylase family protein [Rhizobiales bacterium]|nr:carboxymuconolactone decarboxylase family protein [Hyphomicrobiales bacterium]OJY43831.1 MAG: hypothetical protein BGP08_14620 [Rhizobiales bacterium 64-17]